MKLGLRPKSALALGSCIFVVLVLALFAARRTLRAIHTDLGAAYSRNITQYNKERILAPVQRELALSQCLAGSVLTRQFLLDENNPAKRALFFEEAKGYRQAFVDKSYSLVSALSLHYYFNDAMHAFSDRPRAVLKRQDPTSQWFFSSLAQKGDFNFNVDYNVDLKLTKVWINVLVKDGSGRPIGTCGSGLDLTKFLGNYFAPTEKGVTPLIINAAGDIQAYPDRSFIDFASINTKRHDHSTIYRLLGSEKDGVATRNALVEARTRHDDAVSFRAVFNGRAQLLSVAYVPDLKWYVVTAVDLNAAQVIAPQLWLPLVLGGVALLVLLTCAIVFGVDRLLLAPLLRLTESARAMAGGSYAVQLPEAGSDELGDLTRAFATMAARVRSHTVDLENKVQERTAALISLNAQMETAHRNIDDSIRYAGLIQNAILPHQEMQRCLDKNFFVLWRPRDVVGGDIYLFFAQEDSFLVGIVDCAGHGVPGAFMTMIAHAAFTVAVDNLGLADPAALLTEVDRRLRVMLQVEPEASLAATHMDAGIAVVNAARGTLTFAGAKVSLFIADKDTVLEEKGDRFSLGSKRKPKFTNKILALDFEMTYYLTSDGLLDQAGGPKGYGFGQTRFTDAILRLAACPVADQGEALAQKLAAYQGELSQRDDVTVVGFKLAKK